MQCGHFKDFSTELNPEGSSVKTEVQDLLASSKSQQQLLLVPSSCPCPKFMAKAEKITELKKTILKVSTTNRHCVANA